MGQRAQFICNKHIFALAIANQMHARRSTIANDRFAVVAFFVLGALIAGIVASVYFAVTHDRVVQQLQLKAQMLETENFKLKGEISTAKSRYSNETKKQNDIAAAATARSEDLELKLKQLSKDLPNSADVTPEGVVSVPEVTITPLDKQSDEASGDQQTTLREWHDKTGANSILAKLLDCDIDKKTMNLLKADGSVLSVSFDDLSLDDIAYGVSVAQSGDLGVIANDDNTIKGLEALTQTSQSKINAAINECSVRILAAYESDATTIQKDREYSAAGSNLMSAVKGALMQIHFLVSDVRNAQLLGPDRRRIDLSLTAPDMPLQFSNLYSDRSQTIKVLTSAKLAETINKGDVIRVIGRINEPSRKTFAALRLTYSLPDVPSELVYNLGKTLYTASGIPGSNNGQVELGYYIDHMRKLNKVEAEAYFAAQKSREVSE